MLLSRDLAFSFLINSVVYYRFSYIRSHYCLFQCLEIRNLFPYQLNVSNAHVTSQMLLTRLCVTNTNLVSIYWLMNLTKIYESSINSCIENFYFEQICKYTSFNEYISSGFSSGKKIKKSGKMKFEALI